MQSQPDWLGRPLSALEIEYCSAPGQRSYEEREIFRDMFLLFTSTDKQITQVCWQNYTLAERGG